MGVKNAFLQQKWPWVLGITIILFPIFMRRSLAEMTCQNKILFGGIIFMIFAMLQMAYFEHADRSAKVLENLPSENERIIDSFNIT